MLIALCCFLATYRLANFRVYSMFEKYDPVCLKALECARDYNKETNFINHNKIRVQRIFKHKDRVPISSLSVGQKIRGRIISVLQFGLFVDVGTTIDGLVHVKDVSNYYFSNKLQLKFEPGQDIDVWVKFRDDKNNKLGLQMFPAQIDQHTLNCIVSIDDIFVGQKLLGKVVKCTEYGCYIDIGTKDGTLPYIHRRKIKSNNRQRKYNAYEILPFGTEENFYVYELDKVRKRVGLTTYSPDLWATRLQQSMVNNSRSTQHNNIVSDYDMDTKSKSIVLASNLDSCNKEEENNNVIASCPRSKVSLLASDHRRHAKLVIDDLDNDIGCDEDIEFNEDEVTTTFEKYNDDNEESDDIIWGGNVITPEERFRIISGGKGFIHLGDLKRWDNVRVFLETEIITISELKIIFQTAAASKNSLGEQQFLLFLQLFSDAIDLKKKNMNEDEDDTDESDSDFEAYGSSNSIVSDDNNDNDHKNIICGNVIDNHHKWDNDSKTEAVCYNNSLTSICNDDKLTNNRNYGRFTKWSVKRLQQQQKEGNIF